MISKPACLRPSMVAGSGGASPWAYNRRSSSDALAKTSATFDRLIDQSFILNRLIDRVDRQLNGRKEFSFSLVTSFEGFS